MSFEFKNICNIRYITDCDTELYSCGDVDGAFNKEELIKYLKSHGKGKLLEHLAFLQFQVIECYREMQHEDEWSEDCQKYYGVD